MRKLAHIERITDIRPIPGADNIEICTVLGLLFVVWKMVKVLSFKVINNKFLLIHDN